MPLSTRQQQIHLNVMAHQIIDSLNFYNTDNALSRADRPERLAAVMRQMEQATDHLSHVLDTTSTPDDLLDHVTDRLTQLMPEPCLTVDALRMTQKRQRVLRELGGLRIALEEQLSELPNDMHPQQFRMMYLLDAVGHYIDSQDYITVNVSAPQSAENRQEYKKAIQYKVAASHAQTMHNGLWTEIDRDPCAFKSIDTDNQFDRSWENVLLIHRQVESCWAAYKARPNRQALQAQLADHLEHLEGLHSEIQSLKEAVITASDPQQSSEEKQESNRHVAQAQALLVHIKMAHESGRQTVTALLDQDMSDDNIPSPIEYDTASVDTDHPLQLSALTGEQASQIYGVTPQTDKTAFQKIQSFLQKRAEWRATLNNSCLLNFDQYLKECDGTFPKGQDALMATEENFSFAPPHWVGSQIDQEIRQLISQIPAEQYKKLSSDKSPMYAQLLNYTYQIGHMVARDILSEDTVTGRAFQMERWIHIANHCLSQGNLFAAFYISSQLSDTSLSNLKASQSLLSDTAKEILSTLRSKQVTQPLAYAQSPWVQGMKTYFGHRFVPIIPHDNDNLGHATDFMSNPNISTALLHDYLNAHRDQLTPDTQSRLQAIVNSSSEKIAPRDLLPIWDEITAITPPEQYEFWHQTLKSLETHGGSTIHSIPVTIEQITWLLQHAGTSMPAATVSQLKSLVTAPSLNMESLSRAFQLCDTSDLKQMRTSIHTPWHQTISLMQSYNKRQIQATHHFKLAQEQAPALNRLQKNSIHCMPTTSKENELFASRYYARQQAVEGKATRDILPLSDYPALQNLFADLKIPLTLHTKDSGNIKEAYSALALNSDKNIPSQSSFIKIMKKAGAPFASKQQEQRCYNAYLCRKLDIQNPVIQHLLQTDPSPFKPNRLFMQQTKRWRNAANILNCAQCTFIPAANLQTALKDLGMGSSQLRAATIQAIHQSAQYSEPADKQRLAVDRSQTPSRWSRTFSRVNVTQAQIQTAQITLASLYTEIQKDEQAIMHALSDGGVATLHASTWTEEKANQAQNTKPTSQENYFKVHQYKNIAQLLHQWKSVQQRWSQLRTSERLTELTAIRELITPEVQTVLDRLNTFYAALDTYNEHLATGQNLQFLSTLDSDVLSTRAAYQSWRIDNATITPETLGHNRTFNANNLQRLCCLKETLAVAEPYYTDKQALEAEAATRIQQASRSKVARTTVAEKRAEKQDTAATRIQAAARAKLAQKAMSEQRSLKQSKTWWTIAGTSLGALVLPEVSVVLASHTHLLAHAGNAVHVASKIPVLSAAIGSATTAISSCFGIFSGHKVSSAPVESNVASGAVTGANHRLFQAAGEEGAAEVRQHTSLDAG